MSDSSSSSSSTVGHSEQTGVIKDGWFMEVNSQWPGVALSLEIEEQLLDLKTKYQHVLVFKSKTFGNVLILDGVIQLTERDEHSYQEMIAHLPLFSHANPENVLVIGGGDGGVIREIVKHSSVKHVTICEIDQGVIDAGKKYFPTVAAAWNDPRVNLFVGDGNEFMKREENIGRFDVIITDSSDPVGPAQALFESPFYQAMAGALKAGGKVCTQAECYWKDLDLIKKLVKESRHIYDCVEYASTQTPTYPLGQIGFLLCSKAADKSAPRKLKGSLSCKEPRSIPEDDVDKFRYYTTELHRASFVLPKFAEDAVNESLNAAEEELEAKAKENAPPKKTASKKAATPKGKSKRKSTGGDDDKDGEKDDKEKSEDAAPAAKSSKTEEEDKEVKDTEVKA